MSEFKDVGDTVTFDYNGRELTGIILVRDLNGTVGTKEPSYDIIVEEEKMLYKHIPVKDTK